jgi:hypothetical protein
MEIELLGNMFWFLFGALCYSVAASFLKIYKFVSIFKDVEASLINLLKVMDNNYSVFINIRKRIAREMMEEKPHLFKEVEVVERFDRLQYTNWRRNVLLKYLIKVPPRYNKYLDPWLERELEKTRKELRNGNIRLEK